MARPGGCRENLTWAGKGRIKGSKNKYPSVAVAVKTAFDVMQTEGGGKYSLLNWGKKNPTEFYRIASKLIPSKLEHAGLDGEAIKIETGVVILPEKIVDANSADANSVENLDVKD